MFFYNKLFQFFASALVVDVIARFAEARNLDDINYPAYRKKASRKQPQKSRLELALVKAVYAEGSENDAQYKAYPPVAGFCSYGHMIYDRRFFRL